MANVAAQWRAATRDGLQTGAQSARPLEPQGVRLTWA
jgi:hypothetical protein